MRGVLGGKQHPCLPSAALGTGPALCERTLVILQKGQPAPVGISPEENDHAGAQRF